MIKIPTESLKVEKMASGLNYLNLSNKPRWDDFPKYATQLEQKLEITFSKKIDAVDIRIWQFTYNGKNFRFVYEDYPLSLNIEPIKNDCDKEIIALKKILKLLHINTV